MVRRGRSAVCLISALLLIVLGAALSWILLDSTSRWPFDSGDSDSESEKMNQVALVSELQALAQVANRTVEEIALEVFARQAIIKASFCTKGSIAAETPLELCDKECTEGKNPRVLMVFPIRGRWELLKSLMRKLLPLLQRPSVCTFIAIVEQTDALAFNKGLLMNAAVMEMSKRVPFDCIIFHDVDLVPLDGDGVHYDCPAYPRHLTVKVDNLPYLNLIGGILALPLQHFLRVNGFSNMFWGWGAEDDDMFERLSFLGIPVTRPMSNPTRYTMLPHRSSASLDAWRTIVLLKMALKRYRLDGLNSAQYKTIRTKIASACDIIGDIQSKCPFERKYIVHFFIDPQPITAPN
ncbi:Beta-14-galactosyltransferase 5 [Taenia crassiceps]|uniref:Beta-1,4-galactosyltransferase n=1 Tax=Taenia crassiceps TaxID=6207 RepID=A0ABR4Q1J3_9CEST